ncbi:MAG: mitochondrial carrier domain-containing protein [Monoraphidium minutum]|nr:MAG: mitochondrial carrier domain-containing protein [Monoraphidium minutum]
MGGPEQGSAAAGQGTRGADTGGAAPPPAPAAAAAGAATADAAAARAGASKQPWPHHLQQKQRNNIGSEFLTSGVSVACATTVTNPLDVIKTRMQLRQAQGGPAPGMVATGAQLVRTEGVPTLWKGLPPAIVRGLMYGGLRLGLYSPTRDWLEARPRAGGAVAGGAGGQASAGAGGGAAGGGGGGGQASAGAKLLAGTLSGGAAAAICSPTELLKVRLQAAGSVYTSALAAARDVVAADGVAGLWKGATPGLVRASVLTASQCATYDEAKRRVMAATGWGDTALTHLACSLVTGLASTTATNPVDVVKTHMFVGGGAAPGPAAVARRLYAAHGAAGFMRGWWANYSRLGPQTCVTFLVAEQLRRLAGLQAL